MDPERIQKQSQNNQQLDEEESNEYFIKICDYLKSKKDTEFIVLEHRAVRTSEEAAIVRNNPLEWGCKTMLVIGVDQKVVELVYRAHLKINWKKLRKISILGRKAKMASQEQVLKLGLKPGGVPPFPHMLGLAGIVDKRFMQIQGMAFNAGHRKKSINMKTKDYPIEESLIFQDITE